ncbi:MAG TPA: hypothetical protein VL171_14810 [Verrucomicrobiae bacterium]|nr:hypothetical protein [Verrucomicrobiae bacterium]
MTVGLTIILAGLLLISDAQAEETVAAGTSTNETTGTPAEPPRAQFPFAKGTLLSNDLLRRILKVRTEDGTRTFIYTEHTYFFRNKEKITPDKLVIGEIVALRFDTDGEGRAIVRRAKAYGKPAPAGAKSTDATDSAK